MKRRTKKIFSSMALVALLCNCFIVPVNAKTDLPNLAEMDYATSMESNSEAWANSAITVSDEPINYDGSFIEVGTAQATEALGVTNDIEFYNYNGSTVQGISRIGKSNDGISRENTTKERMVVDEFLDKEEVIKDTSAREETSADVLDDEEVTEDALQETETTEDTLQEEKTIENTLDEEEAAEDALQEEKTIENVLDEEVAAGNTLDEKVSDEKAWAQNDIQPISAPTIDLIPSIKNPETLRDGMITTETEIEWIFVGDATKCYFGGFPAGYVTEYETYGFTTKIYTPGTYYILFYGENAAGEQSEIDGYIITVVSEFVCQTIEDNVSSVIDSKTYSVDIDFTDMDAAAVCLVRTGKSELQLHVTDESGNTIETKTTNFREPKRWLYIEKPYVDAGVCHYTITVSVYSYDASSGAFRVMIGNKNDAEAMMGGLENVIELDMFYDERNNYILGSYIPRGDEYWFATTMSVPAVFTLLSNNSHLRFKLLTIDDLNVFVDSNDWANAHSTKFTGSYSYAEKIRFEGFAGKFYLVLYNNSPSKGSGVLEGEFRLSAGQPMYGLSSQQVSAGSVVVNSSSTYSSTTLNLNSSSIPDTAVMNEAYLGYVSTTQMGRWRLLAPGASSYRTSSTGNPYITFNYSPASTLNTNAKGMWDLGLTIRSGGSSMTCYPRVTFSYYYEYGDRALTLVPAE